MKRERLVLKLKQREQHLAQVTREIAQAEAALVMMRERKQGLIDGIADLQRQLQEEPAHKRKGTRETIWTEERIARFKALYSEGAPVETLVKEFSISASSVYVYASEFAAHRPGRKPNPPRKPRTKATPEQVERHNRVVGKDPYEVKVTRRTLPPALQKPLPKPIEVAPIETSPERVADFLTAIGVEAEIRGMNLARVGRQTTTVEMLYKVANTHRRNRGLPEFVMPKQNAASDQNVSPA